MPTPVNLYQSQQVYQFDQLAIKQDRQPARQLMGRAAQAVWREIQRRWPSISRLVIVAGAGNNGGDAFALAILARKCGLHVELFMLGDFSRQSAESCYYRQAWEQGGGITQPWQGRLPDAGLIVDGLLGIGLNKTLKANWLSAIELINAATASRVSIDIPSGLNADTGSAMPQAIKADLTVSFIARKIGCFLADGPDYCGELVFDDLGLSYASSIKLPLYCQLLDSNRISLPALRKNNCYKNQFGHVLVIGGDRSLSGAVRLAGITALRSGAGLVSLCVHPENKVVAATQHAELMVSDWNDLPGLLEQASVLVVGPGLGQSDQAKQLLKQLGQVDKPMVIDADALQSEFLCSLKTDKCVITPHPGEAARLLETHPQQIQQDRVGALQSLNSRWPVATVLKGAGTLVGSAHGLMALCSHGHAGMASAGMGDVLAGLIAGYLAQGLPALQAAQSAVLVHALAAENFAHERDAASLIASDIIDRIPLVTRDIRLTQSQA